MKLSIDMSGLVIAREMQIALYRTEEAAEGAAHRARAGLPDRVITIDKQHIKPPFEDGPPRDYWKLIIQPE